jgi:hypothetical protein
VATPGVAPRPVKPSVVWIVVGSLLIAAGVVAAIGLIVTGVVITSNKVDKFARVLAPGTAPLTFKHAGDFTIYYEYRSDLGTEGVFDTSSDPPLGLTITMTAADGTAVPVRRSTNEVSFSFNGRAGKSVAKVTIPSAGDYTMVSTTPGSDTRFVLAVGPSVLGALVGFIVSGLVVGFLLVAGGIALVIVVAIKRSRRKRAQRGVWTAGPRPVGPPGGPLPAPRPPLAPGSPLPPPPPPR